MQDHVLSIETCQIRKTFGTGANAVEAVRGIDLAIKRGEIFGLLGPNGAGKTTTMRMLCTLLMPTSGTIKIDGLALASNGDAVRHRIGYVGQKGGMEPDATGRENLILQAELFCLDRQQACQQADEVIASLDISLFADRKAKTYSGGQRRIFDVATAIINKPTLLFLDEPTTGLDPQSRARVWDIVQKLHQEGTTVCLTTHYLDEADSLCDRVAIVDHGVIIALGSPAELKAHVAHDIIILGVSTTTDAERAYSALKAYPSVREIQIIESSLHVYIGATGNRDTLLPELMSLLHRENITINMVQLSRPTLDDVFLKLTGRNLRDTEK